MPSIYWFTGYISPHGVAQVAWKNTHETWKKGLSLGCCCKYSKVCYGWMGTSLKQGAGFERCQHRKNVYAQCKKICARRLWVRIPVHLSTHKIFINVCLHQLASEIAFTCYGEMSLRRLADVPQLKNIKTDFMDNCSAKPINLILFMLSWSHRVDPKVV